MSKHFELPEIISIFPLPGALLLPRARLPLHIFEPRYLAMVDDALKSPERLIGMIQPNRAPGRDDDSGLHRIGCVGRITQFSETEDGRYLITLTGLSRFRVLEEIEGFTPYRRTRVSWSGFERDRGPADCDQGFQRQPFLELLGRFLKTREMQTDWGSLTEAEDELLINALSMLLPFEPEDKQALLEAPSLGTRRETLVTLIEFAMRSGDSEDIIQ